MSRESLYGSNKPPHANNILLHCRECRAEFDAFGRTYYGAYRARNNVCMPDAPAVGLDSPFRVQRLAEVCSLRVLQTAQ